MTVLDSSDVKLNFTFEGNCNEIHRMISPFRSFVYENVDVNNLLCFMHEMNVVDEGAFVTPMHICGA